MTPPMWMAAEGGGNSEPKMGKNQKDLSVKGGYISNFIETKSGATVPQPDGAKSASLGKTPDSTFACLEKSGDLSRSGELRPWRGRG